MIFVSDILAKMFFSATTLHAPHLSGVSAQWGGHMNPSMMGWGTGWFGMIFMIIFWILVILGLVLLVKWLFQSTRNDAPLAPKHSSPVDILKERFALGEIDKEEYEEKLRLLEK